MNIPEAIIYFLEKQGFVIVSTLDHNGNIHSSAKGIVKVKSEGRIYILDLYRQKTFENLKRNPTITLTAIDEHTFVGYSLQGEGKIVEREKIEDSLIKEWEKKIIQRISRRLINSLKENKKSSIHPESRLPSPEYLISIKIEKITDLTPRSLKL